MVIGSQALSLINACHITGRDLKDVKVAVSGAGAAGLSCAGLIRHLGVKAENILMCDSTGVVYEGRGIPPDVEINIYPEDAPIEGHASAIGQIMEMIDAG